MPVVDWTRTDLDFIMPDGSTALRFEHAAFTAFDLYILKRPGAESDYSDIEIERARARYEDMSGEDIKVLSQNIIAGLPGAMTKGVPSLSLFQDVLDTYKDIGHNDLRANLLYFIKEITPAAESVGAMLAIHPDDPPFSLFGLPRVVSNASDVREILSTADCRNNGLCFCTGSYGVLLDNDLPAMIREFEDRIHFVHLRSTKRDNIGNFHEANHLEGDVDMYAVIKELSRVQQGRKDTIPMRPDHGHKMLDDLSKSTNPGYSAIGRLRGLAELRGLEEAIVREVNG